jgi:histidine phosphotransferase ChpT
MSERLQPTDLELAALISSKICHDVIGPVGAINNGLEILDEEENADAKSYAMHVIRNVTEQAAARLQFARFAFGAAGSAGTLINVATVEEIAQGFVGKGKHSLSWRLPAGEMTKERVKLLLNLIASGVTALPRGGEIDVAGTGSHANQGFVVTCRGPNSRPPQHLTDLVQGVELQQLDAMTIQPYYTWRLAQSSGMHLEIARNQSEIVLLATPKTAP